MFVYGVYVCSSFKINIDSLWYMPTKNSEFASALQVRFTVYEELKLLTKTLLDEKYESIGVSN